MSVCRKCGGNKRADGGCNICEILAAGETGMGLSTKGWPKKSPALSCHPKQVKQANARARKHGLTGVHYQPNGMCVLADNASRRKLMRLEGMHDNRSFL